MIVGRRSEAGQHRVLDTEKPPWQARAIIHVENNCHGVRKYRGFGPNDNPAATEAAGSNS